MIRIKSVNVDGHKQPRRTSPRDDGFIERREVSEGLKTLEWDKGYGASRLAERI